MSFALFNEMQGTKSLGSPKTFPKFAK